MNKGQVIIYQAKDKSVRLDVKLEKDTIWLTQSQIALLFGTKRPAITKHLGNIFSSGELKKYSVCSILEHTAADGKVYSTTFYDLDAIISVGYRVNSKQATRFRIWATGILKKHLLEGYTVNEERLKARTRQWAALQKALRLIGDVQEKKALGHSEAVGLLEVLNSYNRALGLLDDYDRGRLRVGRPGAREKFVLTYEETVRVVAVMRKKFSASNLFGREKDNSLKSSIAAVYQTFDGKDLYPGAEEKAANLLYFLVKNHSFVDGNKRIAAALFLWFLEQNAILFNADGAKRLSDNALVALTLMIAESHPRDRQAILDVAVNLITGE